ncbi:phage tail assembly protein [Stenotrophomonas sp.]|uniref:phage tail assembly protein n=1 Tax=Stenotrophomonas sp. TaxID=69392 RepID=UPI0028ABFF95|nr:phage tail assembly protein [Stenotrophomonas sp.]
MSKPTYSAPIVLEQPIKRGETKYTEITLRKPTSGELRGLKLTDLLNGDVNATIRLVPRISNPSLTEQEVAALDVADLLMCADAVAVFLQKKGSTAESPAA